MRAFHGKQEVKDFYLARVLAHRLADEIIQGRYWTGKRGCAVGCTLHSDKGNHEAYETELGIPVQLAYAQDRLFENLPLEDAKLFPEAFLEAIPVGADLALVGARLMCWILEDVKKNACEEERIDPVLTLYRRVIGGAEVTEQEWDAVCPDDTEEEELLNLMYTSVTDVTRKYFFLDAFDDAIELALDRWNEPHGAYTRRLCDALLSLFRQAPVTEEEVEAW